MEVKERTFTEKSGMVEIAPGCPGGLYLVYVETAEKKTVRILDGPPGLGVSVDFPLGLLYSLLIELTSLYNETAGSPMVEFSIQRREDGFVVNSATPA